MKSTIAGVILLVILLLLGLVLIAPVFMGTGHPAYKAVCQSNMKELGLAFAMYIGDHNGMLPSSAVCGSYDRAFRSTVGHIPPVVGTRKTVFELLYPYRKSRDIQFCPSDPRCHWDILGHRYFRRPRPEDPSGYVLKKAINQAWLDPKIKARHETDYRWPDVQLLFYERGSFHWGNMNGDLSDPRNTARLGASVNCLFIDGHVKTHRITEFEPDYYNTSMTSYNDPVKPQINPRLYGDRLQ